MPIPLWAISAGAGAVSSLLGGIKRGRGSFGSLTSDPELELLQHRIQSQASERRARDINEVGRAGLLGSGTAMNFLRSGEVDLSRSLEDAALQVMARRRREALEREKMDREDSQNRLGLLGGFSKLGGSFLEDYLKKRKGSSGYDSFDPTSIIDMLGAM